MPPTKQAPKEMITPTEAAQRMGITPDYIRQQMRKGAFPVGFAFNPKGLKWVYCIPRAAFEKYMAGEPNADMEQLASMIAAKVVEKLNAQ